MSKFNIGCPHCGGLLEVQDEWTGVSMICPFCRGNFIVPGRNMPRGPYASFSGMGSAGAARYSGESSPGKNRALVSMILGVVGVITGALGMIPGIIAIIFSKKATDEMAKTGNCEGRGFALAGMVLGIAGTALAGMWLIVLLSGLGGMLDFDDDGDHSTASSGRNRNLSFKAEMGRRALDSLPSEQREALLNGSGSFNDEANALANLSSDDLDGVIEYLQSTSE